MGCGEGDRGRERDQRNGEERVMVKPEYQAILHRNITLNYCFPMANQFQNYSYQSDLTDSSAHF